MKKHKILLVSPDWVGPIRNGGIGTAFTALAKYLAASSHSVTALYTLGSHSETKSIAHWIDCYQKMGVDFVPLPSWKGSRLDAPWFRIKSYEIYQWLKARSERDTFDAIIFPEWNAEAYYSLAARRTGAALEKTPIVVVTHSPTGWADGGNFWLPDSPDQVDLFEMESSCVEMADYVVSPSAYMFEWMAARNWKMPEDSHRRVIRNLMPDVPAISPDSKPDETTINEVVFFGRLELRKGLEIFCRGLDRMNEAHWEKIEKITFLGKRVETATFSSTAYLEDKSKRWPKPLSVIDDKDSAEALAYLRGNARLAVIPSLVENSPYTVLECLSQNIAFLAADVGGIAELIHPEDNARVLFKPTPAALAQKLIESLQSTPKARLRVSEEAARQQWTDFLSEVSSEAQTKTVTHNENYQPKVSVCLVHHERPHYLRQAIDSLERQTYHNFEVVLVDDGSQSPAAQAMLNEIEADFARRGWKIIRQENAYLGAARNTAAKHATGEYLLFMDDDNIAFENEIELFVKGIQKSGADIMTCPLAVFSGNKPPQSGRPEALWIPLGNAVGVGAIRNGFGDANAIVKKSVFERIGGFTEDYGIGHEDWEFFAKAALSGAKMGFYPEPLFWYRASNDGMLRSGNERLMHYRSLRPYLESLPPALGAALGYGLHLHLNAEFAWKTNQSVDHRSLDRAVNMGASFIFKPRYLLKGVKLMVSNPILRLKFKQALKEGGVKGAYRKSVRFLSKHRT